MEEQSPKIKPFLLPNGEQLLLWTKDSEFYGIAHINGNPTQPHLLNLEQINDLIVDQSGLSKYPTENPCFPALKKGKQLPIGFFSSNALRECVPPRIVAGRHLASGGYGHVFECTSPPGYVVKIIQIDSHTPKKSWETRWKFFKEAMLACRMGMAGIGPFVECFWIVDGVTDVDPLKGFGFKTPQLIEGDSFGFILSKQMGITFSTFLTEYPDSYPLKTNPNQSTKAQNTRSINQERVKKFTEDVKRVCLESQIFIDDMNLDNIMLNIAQVDQKDPTKGYLIYDIRIVDFGIFDEFSFSLDSLILLSKGIEDRSRETVLHEETIQKISAMIRRRDHLIRILQDIVEADGR